MRKDIEESLKKFNVNTFGNNKKIALVERRLSKDETVFYIAPTNAVIINCFNGKKDKRPGVFAITNKRLIFLYKVLFSESMEVIALNDIKTFNCSGDSITGSYLEIGTTSKSYNFLISYKKDIREELLNLINSVIENYNNSKNVSNNSNMDYIKQIEKLFELKEKGIITEEEFNKKRSQLLELDTNQN